MTTHTGLFRSRTDKVIGGVAGGIAKTLNTESSIIRILFILLVLLGGSGILLYVILWIALPEEGFVMFNPETTNPPQQEAQQGTPGEPGQPMDFPPKRRYDGSLIAGMILILIGLVFLADRYIPHIHFWHYWPLILVVIGIVLIYNAFSKPKNQ
jgi:phage shock protein C